MPLAAVSRCAAASVAAYDALLQHTRHAQGVYRNSPHPAPADLRPLPGPALQGQRSAIAMGTHMPPSGAEPTSLQAAGDRQAAGIGRYRHMATSVQCPVHRALDFHAVRVSAWPASKGARACRHLRHGVQWRSRLCRCRTQCGASSRMRMRCSKTSRCSQRRPGRSRLLSGISLASRVMDVATQVSNCRSGLRARNCACRRSDEVPRARLGVMRPAKLLIGMKASRGRRVPGSWTGRTEHPVPSEVLERCTASPPRRAASQVPATSGTGLAPTPQRAVQHVVNRGTHRHQRDFDAGALAQARRPMFGLPQGERLLRVAMRIRSIPDYEWAPVTG